MSQASDVVIANQGFPSFRSDLNTVLAAVNSLHAGATEPSTVYASQLWYDTTTNLLKMRNLADDAWITLAYIDETNDEMEVRTGAIQANDGDGIALKTDEGTTRMTVLDTGVVDVAGTFTAARGVGDTEVATLSADKTIDFSTYQNFVYTLGASITLLNPTTESVGQSGFIVFIQDGTGGRGVSLGTDYETAGAAGLTLSTTASATDVVPYIVAASGRILLGTPQLAFS